MASSRLIVRSLTRWHHATAAAPRRALRSISFFHAPKQIQCTSSLPLSGNHLTEFADHMLTISQHRYRSDFLKYRAVEALKKKNAAAGGSANSVTDTAKQANIDESNKLDDEFGDDHQLAGLTSVAYSPSSPTVAAPPMLRSNIDSANPSPSASIQSTVIATTDTTSNTKETNKIHEVSNSNVDSNPWAHMQLHEFAPKIVVVGVGGAGTNAVNNMVASGLSGEFVG